MTARRYLPRSATGRHRRIRTGSSSCAAWMVRGGFAVIETDNAAGLLAEVSKFTTWSEFTMVPVVEIIEGVNLDAAGVDLRESVRFDRLTGAALDPARIPKGREDFCEGVLPTRTTWLCRYSTVGCRRHVVDLGERRGDRTVSDAVGRVSLDREQNHVGIPRSA